MKKVIRRPHDKEKKNQTGRESQKSPVFQEASPLPDPSTSSNGAASVRALDQPIPSIVPLLWSHAPNKLPLTQGGWRELYFRCLDQIYYLESLLPDHLRQDAGVCDGAAGHRPIG